MTRGRHRGGGTNSRPNDKSGAQPAGGGAVCSDAGVDTVRFRFRGVDGAAGQLLRHEGGAREGPRGELWRLLPACRVGAYPDGLVYVEGRAAALVAADTRCHDLLPPADLALAEQAARAQLERVGVDAREHAALGRVDLAGELRFSRGDEGVAFLHALRALDVPWGKVGTEGGKAGLVETVYVRGINGRSVHARAYDKGREAGTDGPGRRIRFERQIRPRKAREQTVAQFVDGDLRRHFLGRLERFLDVPAVCVGDVVAALESLGEAELRPSTRNRLAGALVYGLGDLPQRTQQRVRRELALAGVALDPTRPERRVVPVGRHLAALASAWETAA